MYDPEYDQADQAFLPQSSSSKQSSARTTTTKRAGAPNDGGAAEVGAAAGGSAGGVFGVPTLAIALIALACGIGAVSQNRNIIS